MKKITDYFSIKELVCPHVYNRFGEAAWDFLDKDLLAVLLFIREHLGKAIYVNNWAWGGDKSQRGLRCCICPLVKEKVALEKVYLSSHIFGKAVDFNVKGMTAEEVRIWIDKHKNELPATIRIEKDVNWVHLGLGYFGQTEKIVYFYG